MKQILALLLLIGAMAGPSQAQIIDVEVPGGAPDSVYQNSVVTCLFSLINTDTLPVSESFIVSVANANGPLVLLDTVAFAPTMLNPGDSLLGLVELELSSANGFVPGSNTIALWVSEPAFVSDTAFKEVWVLDQPDTLGCFPVPGANYPPVVYQTFTEYEYLLRNTGSSTFQADVDMHFGIEGSGPLQEIATAPGISLPTLAPDGEYTGDNFLLYSQISAVPGGNTIVIWPRAPDHPNVFISDSLRINYILAPVGIHGADPVPELRMYPNPAYDVTRIYVNGQLTVARSVRVVDGNGRLVAQQQRVSGIDLSQFDSGIYFIEITLDSGQAKLFKALRY